MQLSNEVMKWGRIVLVILAVYLGVQTLNSVKDLSQGDPAKNTISVTGEGEVLTVPDIAQVHFSVSAESDTADEAQSQVTEKMDAVLAGLKEMGIEEKDIKTTNYTVWPKYQYISVPAPGRQVQDGFTAAHDVTVKIRKTDDAAKVLTMLGEKGATNISNIMFTTDDPEALFQEARVLAIKDAKDKAKALAEELDVRLVRVVNYSDSNYGYPVPMYREASGMGGAVDLQKATANLPTGENQIKVNVTVTYEIR